MPPTVRNPAVAGTFYPASKDELGATIDGLIGAAAPAGSPNRCPKVLVVPHAGYIYSGPIAAAGFARIRAASFTRVVVIGPAHRVFVAGLAWPGTTHLRTPLGDLEVDVEAIEAIPELVANPQAHAREHSLEVELPFIQTLAPNAKIVPLITSQAAPELVGKVLDALWGGPETLIVISSDLSHFLPYAEARVRDRDTAAKILAFDASLTGDEACGCTGLNGLAWVARKRGLSAELVDLRSSGDTAGTRAEVVGYGAFAYYEGAP